MIVMEKPKIVRYRIKFKSSVKEEIKVPKLCYVLYNSRTMPFGRYVPNLSGLYLPDIVNKVIWASGSYLPNLFDIYLPDVV